MKFYRVCDSYHVYDISSVRIAVDTTMATPYYPIADVLAAVGVQSHRIKRVDCKFLAKKSTFLWTWFLDTPAGEMALQQWYYYRPADSQIPTPLLRCKTVVLEAQAPQTHLAQYCAY